jgi:small subunit ribosomal protein S7
VDRVLEQNQLLIIIYQLLIKKTVQYAFVKGRRWAKFKNLTISMRKAKPKKRYVLPDPKFRDVMVTKFVNNLMYDGKKSTAFTIFYGALDKVEDRTKEKNGLELFKKALNNVMPSVEVKSRRVGGATFQVPTEVRADRKLSVGMKWLILYARKRGDKTMIDRLANEIMAAAKGEGAAVKKKDDTHRMAEANKAFSHFRF